ncbi:uncharacterized protein L969DRAFT_70844 [Mixia osmundae IAM 14324]|uniref:W2 domain-containing protein n=1 Tax=Mixia osmundae (strain CBS 9802 / IAM 14324 / JCM 22182 / KY 12970) TaxID=764103 RepID=G7DXZ4_MIXOS|nr:uncharacterized protein L969DRAFT_70844 [Mixia osmundae IAM 14324]KEI41355.1 hypothetical protein L969DRAFT_70844 [Mixia osmundae IAM 14324]GAA95454.1 hypothetical protein E5Q_02108 [Mixia osmundae IAM 14324]
MASIINIRTDVKDAHYRYKMPSLLIKIEGRGNGIKTTLPNISDVAKSLARPAAYPTKFFGCELGAQTITDDKNDRFIVNGAHDLSRLRELLDSFIDKFVLCPSCKNPETDLVITRDEMILRDCKACGHSGRVDMAHKLTTFILKNPPKKEKKAKGATSKKGATKGSKAADGKADNGDVDEDVDSNDEMTRKIQEGAKEMEITAPISPAIGSKNGNADDDDADWSVDTSKAAVQARMAGLQEGVQSSLILADDEAEEGPYDVFAKWVAENREGASDSDIYKKAVELGIEKKHKTPQFLVSGLFTEDVLAEIPKRKLIMKKLTPGDSEKHAKSLLGGFEKLVGDTYPDLTPKFANVLMLLYQNDVLPEEDVIVQFTKVASSKYVDKETSKKVRRAGKPFVAWLEEAESEDDEE